MPSPDTRNPSGTLVIGVLGGIASGKSQVARLLAGSTGVVIDADQEARAVLGSLEVVDELAREFGPSILHADGSVDRERLGALVFGSREDLRRLESFTHPRIRARIRAALDAALRSRVPRIVLDVPLLLENDAQHGLVAACDALVFVDSDERLREERAQRSRGWKAGEVARREAAQMPLISKRQRATHVIHNEGSPVDLEREVARVLSELRAR